MIVMKTFYHIENIAKHVVCRNLLLLRLIIFSILISFNSSVTASFEQLQKIGSGTMSWLFFDIYDASLSSIDGHYTLGKYPQALTISYLKNIKKKKLIIATQEQWELQKIENKNTKHWLQSLENIWPDIQSGDRLTFYVDDNKKGYFYLNNNFLGGINSEEFSDAFLAIWLSEKTSQPKLRQQLLGL